VLSLFPRLPGCGRTVLAPSGRTVGGALSAGLVAAAYLLPVSVGTTATRLPELFANSNLAEGARQRMPLASTPSARGSAK
jgi:hypothetical protein